MVFTTFFAGGVVYRSFKCLYDLGTSLFSRKIITITFLFVAETEKNLNEFKNCLIFLFLFYKEMYVGMLLEGQRRSDWKLYPFSGYLVHGVVGWGSYDTHLFQDKSHDAKTHVWWAGNFSLNIIICVFGNLYIIHTCRAHSKFTFLMFILQKWYDNTWNWRMTTTTEVRCCSR